MAVTIEILTISIGSQITSTIASDEAETKNDFQVLLILDGNGTNLTESDITLSSGTLVSLTGKGVSWEATLRPPETAAEITLTVAADAFSEGNAETTHDIRVSTSFPDADAESPTQLFSQAFSGITGFGVAVTPTRIIVNAATGSGFTIKKYTHSGVDQTAESISLSQSRFASSEDYIDVINGDLLLNTDTQQRSSIERFSLSDFSEIEGGVANGRGGICHTERGIVGYGSVLPAGLVIQPYGTTQVSDRITYAVSNLSALAHSQGFIYATSGQGMRLIQFTSDTEIDVAPLNINAANPHDISIYGDTLYSIPSSGVYTLDLKKYRPLAKNTKTTIYPVFANEGDTIDLTQYSPDAERIVPDVGFDKPDYLTFNTSNELEIDTNAVTETHPVYIPLKAINRIDATETGTFGFYLIIQQANAPIWREFADLSMPADSAFNLFDVVEGADSITGTTLPTGASVSNGRLNIGTQGGTVVVRATNATGNTNHTFIANVVQAGDPANYSNEFRYRVQIANIDVTSDLKVSPSVSESLDAVILNESVLDEVSFTLRNDVQNGFRFSDTTPNNFWIENSLTEGGYRVGVKIFVESLVSGSIVQSLLFSGVIFDSVVSTENADIVFTIVDLSYTFDRRSVEGLGQLTKWDALRQQTDEASFEGAYTPEGAVTPMQVRTGRAWSDRSAITISDLGLPREGPAFANTGYLTPTNFNVSGGFFATPPLLEVKPERRSEDVPYLIQQLGINGAIFNSHVMLSEREADMPFILNRGSVPFSVENTRSTRLLVGWVHDPTNDCVLMLLSNPEAHIADILVQYDVADDFHRITQTFDKGIKTHRITRRNANNYYILTSAPITQDRSATTLPRTIDKTASAYDSLAEGSDVRIYTYRTNTGVLTAHVEETDAYPPQLGIHYHVGFENALYIDEFEGIVADYRGSFPVQSSDLYYRYAKDGEFGIASVDTSGTVTELIDQTTLNYHNHLNFAFDLTSGGDIYFVYSVGDTSESSLVIKQRTSAGVESTILTDTQDLDDLTALDDAGGAYLGCHEALFHDDTLYFLAPIQRVDADDATPPVYTRSREKAAGMALYKCDVTAGTPSLTMIEKWDFVTHSACNLIVHGGAVHYAEQPIAAERFKPINSSL